jgi:hypothetical protein
VSGHRSGRVLDPATEIISRIALMPCSPKAPSINVVTSNQAPSALLGNYPDLLRQLERWDRTAAE